MRSKLIVVVSLALLSFVSCNEGEIYFKFQKINRGTWKSREVVEFKMDSLSFNPSSKYDVGLELIYSSLYPYKDIWLTISHNLTDSLFVNDTVKVNLVDGDGNRLGHGNASLFQLSVPYKTGLHLDSASAYILQIGNAMKDYRLVGVDKVGVLVKEVR